MIGFSRLYRDNYAVLLAIAAHRLSSLQDAEDVVSEAFRIALEHYSDGGVLTAAWLYVVVRNLIGNEYRSRARRSKALERLRAEHHDSRITDERHLPHGIHEALASLSTTDQQVLTMLYWEELTVAEAAARAKTTSGAMKVRAMRARRAFTRALERVQSPEIESDHRERGNR